MPFIVAKFNIPVDKKKELVLKAAIGRAIEVVPGKNEGNLLLAIEQGRHLYLRGDDSEPVAYIEVHIWGNESHTNYDMLTGRISRTICEILNIPQENIFIRYGDIEAWGVDGLYIDRNGTL